MRTKVELEFLKEYPRIEDYNMEGTALLGLFAWPRELDLPLLADGARLRLGGVAHHVSRVVVEEDGSQMVTCSVTAHDPWSAQREMAELEVEGWERAGIVDVDTGA